MAVGLGESIFELVLYVGFLVFVVCGVGVALAAAAMFLGQVHKQKEARLIPDRLCGEVRHTDRCQPGKHKGRP
jgi:hypothetical protein